jgi:phospholipase C
VTLPDGNPVWLQTNAAGETYAPFRMDIKGTNATWMGCLPHDWPDQSRARNNGRHDAWLDNKKSGRKEFAHLPLTMGFHNRTDLPFYYALADAFTVCDQNFCSSLTGTNPNRLHLWSGTIRATPEAAARANVRNSDAESYEGVTWKTFPERLEDHGVSWRVYQNELWLNTGLKGEAGSWLGNFGDNPLEYFSQYRVRFARRHREHLVKTEKEVAANLEKLKARPKPWTEEMEQEAVRAAKSLEWYRKQVETWAEAGFAKLTEQEKELHRKAFTTNEGDPHFREMEEVTYSDDGTPRKMMVPRGDVLHQFRADVKDGKLPAVSWLVAPQIFSDHPDSPWYGAWYISEVLDILTSRPEVWAKTIFILCYDENDGYFDHIPPFVPPDPLEPGSGKASPGLKTELEFVRAAQEKEHSTKYPHLPAHTGPIGLGYRVPLVVASPWTRGGYVCSQVFDHTSILRLLEKVISHRTGKEIRETNITPWRRAVCGDLTAAFRPATAESSAGPEKVDRASFLRSIHQAQFKPPPTFPRKLTPAEIKAARQSLRTFEPMPQQEKGARPACALPYELSVHGGLTEDRLSFAISFAAGREIFGHRAAGAPFHVYAPGGLRVSGSAEVTPGRSWSFAAAAGERIHYAWPLMAFPGAAYHLCAHGPNGFYREFRGNAEDPALEISLEPVRTGDQLSGDMAVKLHGRGAQPLSVTIEDVSYGGAAQTLTTDPAGGAVRHVIPLQKSDGWYDVRVTVAGSPAFSQRFAGHLETGRESRSDPLISGA